MLGGGSLSDAIKNFEKKFKDKSGLKWEDRAEEPKNGKCQFDRGLFLLVASQGCPSPCHTYYFAQNDRLICPQMRM